SSVLVDYVLFSALCASAAGHAVVAAATLLHTAPEALQQISLADASSVVAACLIGFVWLQQRQGRMIPRTLVRRSVLWVSGGLMAMIVAHIIALVFGYRGGIALPVPDITSGTAILRGVAAVGACLFVLGSGEAMSHAGADFPQPKVHNLRRAMWFA